jgi:hypothetical protein
MTALIQENGDFSVIGEDDVELDYVEFNTDDGANYIVGFDC